MNEPPVLQLDHVARTYEQGGLPLAVIRDATLTIRAGDLVGLQGPSGAGKSTLLHVAGLLEMPDGGEAGSRPMVSRHHGMARRALPERACSAFCIALGRGGICDRDQHAGHG